ncbi:SRPBCC family protein [Chelatococcus asaccharovorans]|uniref:SRPBCC family protein n=1 Tax=Chelatococcus asaccharovorans TaxID=28210 RepID=UPI00224C7345|nr:SRPBCC family protein [Chelatococcus asaccharovorans]CAH1666472.1 Polyketide cyclase/dehydrase/lipid transport protein [Chelatococcus asaccharovorans]CAH1681476.1 Polyketide cyclase/dehydrase/lipid transport protein [Chelatococcus asaccharovorans]
MANVTVSSIIEAPIDAVWEVIRDFDGLPGWHPRMVESVIEAGPVADRVGCVRRLTLVNGAVLRERLLALSDHDHSIRYAIEETPQPISNHVATLRLARVTDGERTFVEWSATFDAPSGEAEKIAAAMGENVFQGGFNALKQRFSRGA